MGQATHGQDLINKYCANMFKMLVKYQNVTVFVLEDQNALNRTDKKINLLNSPILEKNIFMYINIYDGSCYKWWFWNRFFRSWLDCISINGCFKFRTLSSIFRNLFAFIAGGGSVIQNGINTISGVPYQLTFWARSVYDTTIVVTVNTSINNINITATYSQYSINFTPSGPTTIQFQYFGGSEGFALDDVSIPTVIICYSGNSLVYSKNKLTNEIKNINAKDIVSDVYEVYSTNDQKFIPVKYNIVTGPTKRYMLIKRNALNEDQPSEDFYVTSGCYIN